MTFEVFDETLSRTFDILHQNLVYWQPCGAPQCKRLIVSCLQEKVCLRYEVAGKMESKFLHEAEMANLLCHENVLAHYGVVIASSYSPSLALVS